ncbi:MAG: methylenetetrahydrofolate reductase [NAD(P)H] [Hyphomicrobiaceae bacterium]|nr:methylenetetrahydrofolate reductase [NAD(P)H] [Hyphomicrobiaceae bacterium]
MTRLAEKTRRSHMITEDEIAVSFEFFPPKTAKMEETLWAAIKRLAPLAPEFVSVTYGAGGSTRERTHSTIGRIIRETSLKPAGHLTCVGASKAEVNDVIHNYWATGVRHIVALRGDPQKGIGHEFEAHKSGYKSSVDLIKSIREIAAMTISVSGYPEMHPESLSRKSELDHLKAKIDAGATQIITQFFFDNAHYLRFVDQVRARGIWCPIIPGIVPIYNYKQVSMFAERCGTSIPYWLTRRFEGLEHDPDTTNLVAAAVAAEQVMDLVDHGIQTFHFYTLNRANLVYATCHLLGLRPRKEPLDRS